MPTISPVSSTATHRAPATPSLLERASCPPRVRCHPSNHWRRRFVNDDHPLWEYVSHRAVHWHYHGVLAPPDAATPLVVLEEMADHRDEDNLDP